MGPHFKLTEFQKCLYKAMAAAWLLINQALFDRYYLRNYLTSSTVHLQNCFHCLMSQRLEEYQVVSIACTHIHLENVRSVAPYVLVSMFVQIQEIMNERTDWILSASAVCEFWTLWPVTRCTNAETRLKQGGQHCLLSKLLSLRPWQACQEFHRSLCMPIWLKGMQSR